MQIHNAIITGSFSYNGADLSNVTSSNAYSASLSSRTTDLESTSSVLVGASSSFSSILTSVSSSQQQISSSLLTLTASYNALSSSYTALSASYNTASSSFSTRITSDSSSMSSRTTQVEKTYASTGSNTFTGLQNFSNTCTPNSFTAGASIYTAGGLQVTQDAYFSSSVFIKGNVTVFGTQSVSYISSSQLDIGTNIITVNTSTPSVRYGGLSVFDSGSTGLTGSIFWDSELNRWIYVNASGSGGGATYGGGMFISGPRNSVGLGCEQGTTACMLLVGQGGDHLTSSMIYHDSTVTCFGTTSTINSAGVYSGTCIIASSKIVVGGTSGDIGADLLRVKGTIITDNNAGYLGYSSAGNRFELAKISSGDEIVLGASNSPGAVALISGTGQDLILRSNGTCERMRITSCGNVGIGTNSPNFKTHISTGDAASITQPTAGTYGLYVQQNTSGNVGGLYIQDGASNSGNSIFVGDNNGAARFVVNTDGLVGIGTNTFTYDTRSAGFAYQGSAGTLYFRTTGAEIYTYNVNAYFGSGTSGYSTIIMSGAGTTALTLASNQAATFASSICATAATFSGKVLINGSGATAQLDITSDASANGITLRNRTGDDYAFFNWRTLGGTELLAEQYIQRTAANTAVMKYTIANANATPAVYLTIASTGVATFACQICVKEAVYINGSFPGVKLDRAGTTAQSDINWKDAGTSVWSIGTAVRAVGSSLDFYSYCTGDNVFKLTQTGITCFSNTICAPRVDLNRCNAATVLSVGNEDSTDDAGVRGLAITTNRLRFGVSPATSTYGTIATNGTNSGITFVTYDNAWTEKMRIACNGDLTIKGNTHCIYTNSAATISFDINVTRGRFYQALTVDGAITKGGGSFKIDHPLESKKDTYNLYHSFVESPKADLIYRGKVTLINGYATVNIDTAADMSEGTFEVLVKDVQCFTTNENGWNFVKGTISGNILTIESDNTNCNDEISWMVIGERNDKWFRESTMVDENGKTIVEKLKSETT